MTWIGPEEICWYVGHSSVGLAIVSSIGRAIVKTCGSRSSKPGWVPGPPLHAEPRTPDGFDGVGGPADFDLCRALTTEEIEQQLARKSSDANRGFPSPGSYGIGRPSPLKLKPCTA